MKPASKTNIRMPAPFQVPLVNLNQMPATGLYENSTMDEAKLAFLLSAAWDDLPALENFLWFFSGSVSRPRPPQIYARGSSSPHPTTTPHTLCRLAGLLISSLFFNDDNSITN